MLSMPDITSDTTVNGSDKHVPMGGAVHISPRVVFALALHAALSTNGVVGIASRYTGHD